MIFHANGIYVEIHHPDPSKLIHEWGDTAEGRTSARHYLRTALSDGFNEIASRAGLSDSCGGSSNKYVSVTHSGGTLGCTFADSCLCECHDLEVDDIVSQVKTYVKRSIAIRALQWTGYNETEMVRFVGSSRFTPAVRSDNPDVTAEVYDKLHSAWIPVRNADWIIEGIKGEFYPCKPEVFEETYRLKDIS